MPQKLYSLTENEREIFQKAATTGNPNWFNSFYLNGEMTGTWWKPNQRSDRWKNGYETLFTVWKSKGRPETFMYGRVGSENEYNAHFRSETGDLPLFHHRHGFLLQPWQLDLARAKQRVSTVIGGVGCGKTLGVDDMMLYWAATLPGFRGLCLAPNSTMTHEMFDQAMRLMEGTKYQERFLLKSPESPFPKIVIGNDHVGPDNTITFLPIGDAKGIRKVLTLTIDAAVVDQTEQLDNVKDMIRVLGGRMRGSYRGRDMLGRMIFLANAEDNDELWDLLGQGNPPTKRFYSAQPKTWDNPFITDDQLDDIKQDVGGDEESIRVYMEGGRPLSGGEHFSAATLMKCKSPELDGLMAAAKEKKTEYTFSRADRIGVYEWALPPRPGRKYLVVADPGYDNPPARNSAVVMVFDYTDFDADGDGKALLWGFFWIFGNHDPWPWINKYVECVKIYGAQFSNAIDASGFQSYYERLIPELQKVNVLGMNLNEQTKKGYLNLAKSMAAKGMFKFPNISRLFQQLSRYTLPDKDLSQDMVAAFLIAVGWLETTFYGVKTGSTPRPQGYDPNSRNHREANLTSNNTSRYQRETRR